MEITYEIKKKGDVTTITKSGMVETFTLEQLEDTIKYNEKTKLEQESNLKLRLIEIENITHFYPKVLKMTPEEIYRVAMYQQKMAEKIDLEAKIKEFKKKLKEQYKIQNLTNEGK